MTRFVVFVLLGVIAVSVVFLTHNVAFPGVRPWSDSSFEVALIAAALGGFVLGLVAENADRGNLSQAPADTASPE